MAYSKVDGREDDRTGGRTRPVCRAPDPKQLVRFDESPVQLIGEVRQPILGQAGSAQRYDYEYRRNGTVNLFGSLTFIVPGARGQSHRAASGRRLRPVAAPLSRRHPLSRCRDHPRRPGKLIDHLACALYQTFPPAEARRILRRLEFHYTPKHASWLNMVEIEIGVLRGQCLDRRIDDPKRLRREITAWERRRNAARSRIKWMFTTDKARAKNGPRLSCHFQRMYNHCAEPLVGRNPWPIGRLFSEKILQTR